MTNISKEFDKLADAHYVKYSEALELDDRISATVHLQISVLCIELRNILKSDD